jgi:hypothetical protein
MPKEARKPPEHMAETLSKDGTTREIDLWYPGVEGNPIWDTFKAS